MTIKIKTDRESWQMVPVSEIVPYEHNSKPHSESQIGQLRESLRIMGFVRPLLLDGERRLIAGHGVLLAAQAEGMEEVPCVVVSGLTETQRRAYVHLDNLLGEMTHTDAGQLAMDAPMLEELGLELDALGVRLPDLEPAQPLDLDDEEDRVQSGKVYHCPKCGFAFEV